MHGRAIMGAEDRINRDQLAAKPSYVISCIAARLPWRSDRLVQALAGQGRLRRRGIGSQISIGVDRAAGAFIAHAWLMQDDRILIGGEVSR